MAVNHERLLALQLPDHECAWSQRDCQLYALATGFGQDPLDERELRYLLEGAGFLVSPTNAITLYYDDRWMQESDVNLAAATSSRSRAKRVIGLEATNTSSEPRMMASRTNH